MYRLALVSALLIGGVAYANPEVKKNTDIGQRTVKEHYQVTRCEGEDCKINSITKFDKPVEKKKVYFGECAFSEEGDVRAQECEVSNTKRGEQSKPVPKERVVEKVVEKVVDKTRNNRIQAHAGVAPNGLKTKEGTNETKVEEDKDLTLGLQYTRRLTEKFNVGASVFTNQSLFISLGLDF